MLMKPKMLFILILSVFLMPDAYTQKSNKKIKITGTVVDINKKPVEGALILVDGVQSNVTTGSKGEYSIKIASDAKTITVLSLFNNTARTTDINGKTVVDITLGKPGTNTVETSQKENETVDIGYGTASKDKTSTSGSKTKLDKASSKTYLNIYDMIRSEVPGVTVIGTSIQLQQGTGSFTSGNEPLFVVDGNVVSQIGNIVPSEVKSISLLKGSSAAIYGSRGSNGVIVITLLK